MNLQEIMRYLPHRYPFLLVDRVEEVIPGERIVAYKNVSANEAVFNGHFPGNPILPGVLIVEAMAQASGILGFKSQGKTVDDGTIFLFAGIEKARFKRPVAPGDVMRMEVNIASTRRNIWKFDCCATVNGEIAAEVTVISSEQPVSKL